MDVVMNYIFLADCALNFRTGYTDRDGLEVAEAPIAGSFYGCFQAVFSRRMELQNSLRGCYPHTRIVNSKSYSPFRDTSGSRSTPERSERPGLPESSEKTPETP